MAIGKRLAEERARIGLSREELARRVGVSYSAIAKYETGERTPPPDVLMRLAEILRVSIDYLLGRTDNPQPPAETPVRYVTEDGVVVPGAWPRPPEVLVPVLGVIRAGEPLYAEQQILDLQPIPEELARTGQYFFLLVRGDSMAPQIRDGMKVLVRVQPDVDNGEIAVVMVNAEEASLKRVYKVGGQLVLKADNPAYAPILVGPEEARIIGKVVEVRFEPH